VVFVSKAKRLRKYVAQYFRLDFNVVFFLKEKAGLRNHLPLCGSVVVSHHQLLNQLIDFYDIRQGGHFIECDPEAVIPSPVATTIQKWRTIKLLRWIQNLHQSAWDNEMLHVGRSSEGEQLLMDQFYEK
jgi:hypothetical protein